MTRPRVSVVIPTRDRAAFVGRAIRNAERQRGVDLEVIVVDDASRDGTAEEVMRHSGVMLIRGTVARGIGAARNLGASHATGDWIAFLDDDDLWEPTKLQSQVAAASAHGADWAYCAALTVNDSRCIVHAAAGSAPERLLADLARYNAVPATSSNLLVARLAFEALHGFDEELHHFADWEFVLRLTAAFRAVRVEEPLVAYIEHGSNMHIRDVEGASAELERFAPIVDAVLGRSLHRGPIYAWINEGMAAKYGLCHAVKDLCRRAWRERRSEHLTAAVALLWLRVRRATLQATRMRRQAPPWALTGEDLQEPGS